MAPSSLVLNMALWLHLCMAEIRMYPLLMMEEVLAIKELLMVEEVLGE